MLMTYTYCQYYPKWDLWRGGTKSWLLPKKRSDHNSYSLPGILSCWKKYWVLLVVFFIVFVKCPKIGKGIYCFNVESNHYLLLLNINQVKFLKSHVEIATPGQYVFCYMTYKYSLCGISDTFSVRLWLSVLWKKLSYYVWYTRWLRGETFVLNVVWV